MKMDELKKEYETITVPEDLRARVNRTLQEGAEEEKKVVRFRPAVLAKYAAAAAAIALALTAVLANASASTSYAVGHVPVIGNIAKAMTFRTFSDTTNDMSASIDSAAVADEKGSTDGKAAAVNAEIKAYTDKVIDDYKALAAETSGQAKASVDVTAKTLTDNADFLILELSTEETAADSAETVKTYCIQKSTGDILSLADLFTEGSDWNAVLTAEVQKQMRAQMAADSDKSFFLDDDMPEADFKGLSADQSFYINEAGDLVLVFDEGAVAPMYMGVQEFTIPAEVMDGIENPAYIESGKSSFSYAAE